MWVWCLFSNYDVCKEVDMNMECDEGTCQCRDEMKWNEEALECQIFMDVNCTDVDTKNIIDECIFTLDVPLNILRNIITYK